MFIRDLADVRDLFSSIKGSITGVGITAYARIVPAYFCPSYHIISLRKTLDLPLLRKIAEIFCLEERLGRTVITEDFNSASLLSQAETKAFLEKQASPRYLLLYQSYAELEARAVREGWVLLSNPSSLRMRVADRVFFQRMADHLQLNRVPGDIYPLDHLFSLEYGDWAGKIDPKFVVQLPEIRKGGGRGTFFVKSASDYQRLKQTLEGGQWRGTKLRTAGIHKFIDGTPASLALCLTRHGILLSGLQRQLIDLPYCRGVPENGIFCGHSWGENPWPGQVQAEALRQARLIGEHLAGMGYKGILGIDFVVCEDKNGVYALECNPRFTGAFPMLSQLHLRHEIIPMEVFHVLEFLGLPYQIEPSSLNAKYAETIPGSHIILFERPGALLKGDGIPVAGLYECETDTGRIYYVGEASDFRAFRNERQFIIIDGPPALPGGSPWRAGPPHTADKNVTAGDPFQRLCRILFPNAILNAGETLSQRARMAGDWVYSQVYGEGGSNLPKNRDPSRAAGVVE